MLVAVWLYAALGFDAPNVETPVERPTQAYAHAMMAEWLLLHGDRQAAAEELRYALVFDHDNATLKARLRALDGAPSAKASAHATHSSKKSQKRTGWLSRQMRKRTLDGLPIEDKTSRRVAESKAD